MPDVLAALPQVHVDVVTDGRLVDIVAAGFDMGLRPADLLPSDMVPLSLGVHRCIAVVASPDFLPRHGKPVVRTDLYQFRCIRARLPNDPDGLYILFEPPTEYRDSVRYEIAYVVTTLVHGVLCGWLPDIRQRLLTVLPGALVGAALWTGAAASLSYSFNTAGRPRTDIWRLCRRGCHSHVLVYQREHTYFRRRSQQGPACESDFNTALDGQEQHAPPGKTQLIARAPRRR